MNFNLENVLNAVSNEYLDAYAAWGPFNSCHEGYAVLEEEMDELKEHVWTNQKKRDLEAMRQEAIQVAAMAVKFVATIDMGRGRK